MHSSTTSAAFINHVLEIAAKHGCDPQRLIQQTGLSASQLDDPIKRVGLCKLRALFAAAVETSGLAHFGLLVGATVRPATYGGLGYVAMTSATLGEATAMIRRFGKMVFDNPSSRTYLTINEGVAMLEDRRITELEPYCARHMDSILSGWTAYGRWLTGSDPALVEVHMMHAPPADPAEYERFFGCPVRYNSRTNALLFPVEALQLPVCGADRRTHKSMLLEAELQMNHSYASLSISRRVRALLMERLAHGESHLEALADEMAMSPRTLQRKLAAEDESFSSILESVRLELAEHYLRLSDLSILNIAFALGFSESSAFSHAFRQSRGISPGDYRKRHSLDCAQVNWRP